MHTQDTKSEPSPFVTDDELERANEILVSIESMREQIAMIATMIEKEPTVIGEPERVVMVEFCTRLKAGLDAVSPELERLMRVLGTKAS